MCVPRHPCESITVIFPQDWRSSWGPWSTRWRSWLTWPFSLSSAWVSLPWWACSSSRATSRTNVSRIAQLSMRQPITPLTKNGSGITAMGTKVWLVASVTPLHTCADIYFDSSFLLKCFSWVVFYFGAPHSWLSNVPFTRKWAISPEASHSASAGGCSRLRPQLSFSSPKMRHFPSVAPSIPREGT